MGFFENQHDSHGREQEDAAAAKRMQDYIDRYHIRSRDLSIADKAKDKDNEPADVGYQRFNWVNDYVELSDGRTQRYKDYRDMCKVPELNQGLNILGDNGSQFDIQHNVLTIQSNDGHIIEILEKCFFKNLDINSNLWIIFRNMCKLGDEFLEVVLDKPENPDQAKHIIALERVKKPESMSRVEEHGNLKKFVYHFDDQEKKAKDLQPWQIVHFRIDDEEYEPYGKSVLEAGRRVWKRLTLMEDAMLVYRIERAPERRVFYIDVGNLPTKEANVFIEKLKRQFRKRKIMDSNTGEVTEQSNPMSSTDDFYLPQRAGGTGSRIETLPEGKNLSEVDDVKYFRDQILRTMGIPSGYLGGTVGEQGATYDPKSYLSNQEIQFARTIERIQKFIVQGLEKIAYIELALQRVDPRKAKDFKIKLTPPSNVDQLMDIEVFNQKFSLIANIKANQFFLPDDWIYKQVLGFSDKDIQKIRLQMQMEAQTSLAAQQGAGGGAGGGGGGGGGDMGGGFSGGNIAGPEAGAEAGGPAGGAGGEPAAPGAAPAPGGAAPAGGAEPGLEVASNNVEFDGHKFLIENTRDIKKMLTYMQLYEQVHMDDKPIDYSQHNSVTKMMTEGQFKGLFKQRDGESILVEKKVRKKK